MTENTAYIKKIFNTGYEHHRHPMPELTITGQILTLEEFWVDVRFTVKAYDSGEAADYVHKFIPDVELDHPVQSWTIARSKEKSFSEAMILPHILSDMTTKTVEDEKRSHVSDRPEISEVDTFLGVVPHADKHIY